MKNLIALSIFVIYGITALGQNFITNPDFTLHSECPTMYSQTYQCIGWYQVTQGTSDYFNVCATGGVVNVPDNFAGTQTSASNAYLGLFTYASDNNSSNLDYREYIGTTFAPLTIGKKYDITILVSLADKCNAATDGIGILFTTYKMEYNIFSAIPITPQIDFSGYGPITDKENWVKLTGSFIADSAYTCLSIGNYKPYANLKIAYNSAPKSVYWDTAAYYYIGLIQVADSMGLIPQPDTPGCYFPSAFTPNYDGINDLFRILGPDVEKCSNYTLNIYNRFGERVFFTQNIQAGWNGIYTGIRQEIGTYFYMATFILNNEQKILKGDVTLVR